ncbi:hypothetical protein A2U01_0073022, partial [Trifolium medium]|nr:hypothetical protein [Trifolium medium]
GECYVLDVVLDVQGE